MRLSELIEGFPVRRVLPGADDDPEVSGVEVDSRRVDPGFLFVALRGERHDARAFAAQAVEAGAVAVLAAPGGPPEGWPGPAGHGSARTSVAWLEADDPRALAGPLAARAFGHPERELVTAAATGTNGKTTVAALMVSVLEAAGRPTALLGTLGYRFGEESVKGDRTTPEAPETVHLLRRWRDHGAEAVSMEASSHALALHRLDGLAFDVGIFTNLTQDHLDYHRDFEGYYAAKRRLFDLLKPEGRAVVNVEDEWGRRLAQELVETLGQDRVVTYGRGAAVQVWDASLSESGTRAVVETPSGSYTFHSPLLGRYNLDNLLATAAAAEALGLPHEAVREGFTRRGTIPGRLEPVDRGQPFPVYIDYAHTPGALEAVLRSVAEVTGRRIIVIFGAGGDRDRAKRAPMGRIAGELAELPILSSDNPRTEDPLAIIQMVEEGVKQAGNPDYRVVPDRREAIRRAIQVAGPEHAVVITGKGHEEVQEIGGQKLPFSDRAEVEKALEERFGATAGG